MGQTLKTLFSAKSGLNLVDSKKWASMCGIGCFYFPILSTLLIWSWCLTGIRFLQIPEYVTCTDLLKGVFSEPKLKNYLFFTWHDSWYFSPFFQNVSKFKLYHLEISGSLQVKSSFKISKIMIDVSRWMP